MAEAARMAAPVVESPAAWALSFSVVWASWFLCSYSAQLMSWRVTYEAPPLAALVKVVGKSRLAP